MDSDLEHAWNINQYLHNYIRQANITAAALFAALAFSGEHLASRLLSSQGTGIDFWGVIGIVIIALGILGIFAVIYPDIESPTQYSGTIFWLHIARYKSPTAYHEAFQSSSHLEEISSQNYEISRIAKQKYKYLKDTTSCTALAVLYSLLYSLF